MSEPPRGPWAAQPRKRWTSAEDRALTAAVDEYGVGKWERIAAAVGTRKDWQCCERWRNQLSPQISKEPWQPEEDELIKQYVQLHGQQWSRIACLLPGRTGNAIKNRCRILARRAMGRAHGDETSSDVTSYETSAPPARMPQPGVPYRSPDAGRIPTARRLAPAPGHCSGLVALARPMSASAYAVAPRSARAVGVAVGYPQAAFMPVRSFPAPHAHHPLGLPPAGGPAFASHAGAAAHAAGFHPGCDAYGAPVDALGEEAGPHLAPLEEYHALAGAHTDPSYFRPPHAFADGGVDGAAEMHGAAEGGAGGMWRLQGCAAAGEQLRQVPGYAVQQPWPPQPQPQPLQHPQLQPLHQMQQQQQQQQQQQLRQHRYHAQHPYHLLLLQQQQQQQLLHYHHQELQRQVEDELLDFFGHNLWQQTLEPLEDEEPQPLSLEQQQQQYQQSHADSAPHGAPQPDDDMSIAQLHLMMNFAMSQASAEGNATHANPFHNRFSATARDRMMVQLVERLRMCADPACADAPNVAEHVEAMTQVASLLAKAKLAALSDDDEARVGHSARPAESEA